MFVQNIGILKDTLKICDQGWYKVNEEIVDLKLQMSQMEEAEVFLPSDILEISKYYEHKESKTPESLFVCCENIDSFSMALKVKEKHLDADVLVLNFANPVNPGGGVRRGARAQEEDLCRRSTLLLSLESESARDYYEYNKALDSYMGSDAIILNPYVEVFKDEKGNCLSRSTVVSVLTCAAPMVFDGLEGLSEEEYETLLYNRIKAIFLVAAKYGYKHIILGAWGCGAFANDGELVADTFNRVIRDFKIGNLCAKDIFEGLYFAVLDHSLNQYNFNAFNRYFNGKNM